MNENPSHNGTNKSDMLEFALRLVTHPGDLRSQNAQLLPGQLPAPLPVAIPFPEGGHVLGSLISNAESINMYLDTPLTPEQVLAFYRQRMEAEGWQTTDVYRPRRGGFVLSGHQNRGGNETFYKGLHDPVLSVNIPGIFSAWGDESNRYRSGPVLVVNAYPGIGGVTDLRLSLEMNGPFPPGPPPHLRGRHSPNTRSLLPALETPEGANQMGGFSSGGPDSAHADTTLETTMDLSTPAAHYKTQLEQAGCVLTGEGQSGPLAWKMWMLEEDEGQSRGILIILKEFGQGYYLTLRVKGDNQGKAATDGAESKTD